MISGATQEKLQRQIRDQLEKYKRLDFGWLIETLDEDLLLEIGVDVDLRVFQVLEQLDIDELIELRHGEIIWRG